MTCTCSYANQNDDYCKHMAVLLYYWQNNSAASSNENISDICALLEAASIIKIKEFFEETLHNDNNLLEKFRLFLNRQEGKVDLKAYEKRLKKLYTLNEWKSVREDIFDKINSFHYLAPLYKEEKIYDRLLVIVLDSPALSYLHSYEDVLKKLYPKELLNKYEIEVQKMAAPVTSRNTYKEIVSLLRHMQDYPNGQETCLKLINEWKVAYKNRRAMMQELEQFLK